MSSKEKKKTEVVLTLCVVSLQSNHLRPDAFLSLGGIAYVTITIGNFIDKNQDVQSW